jgi:hypothetical protein
MPGFRRGSAPRFSRSFGPRFDRRFNRGFVFDPQFRSRFNRRFFDPRFRRRFNRGFFFFNNGTPYGFGSGYGFPNAGYLGGYGSGPGYGDSSAGSVGGGYDSGSGYGDPNASFLSGYADLIRARGDYQVSQEQADLMTQQADAEKDYNRRRVLDQWLNNREHLPAVEEGFDPEEGREWGQRQWLRRMQHDPPATEIYSAEALNVLLADLQRLRGTDVLGPPVPLSPDLLEQINVAPPDSSGNIGLLRNQGRLTWPPALETSGFSEEREQIDSLTRAAARQAADGRVDAGTVKGLRTALDQVRRKLGYQVTELPWAQYLQGQAFLDSFKQALRALDQPNAPNYFNGKWSAQGATVGGLVAYLTDQGLVFVPSVPGQEAAYAALYQALVRYDLASNALVAEPAREKSEGGSGPLHQNP